jgi:hypothetical protein
LVKANASFKKLEPIVVTLRPEQYIDTVEKENPIVEEQDDNEKPWEPKGRLSAKRREDQQQDAPLQN